MTELKQFSREEIKKTNSKERTLIILHDKVYDVTEFLNEHPGGEEILIEHGGKDGSEDFDDVGHSTDAFEMMSKYLVGEIIESERRNNKPKKGWTVGYNAKQQEKYAQGPGLPASLLIAALAIVIISVYYYL